MKVTNISPLIQVHDMQESINFYHDVLGFEVAQLAKETTGHLWWALLKHGGATLMLNSKYEGGAHPDQRQPGQGQDITFYFNIDDVDAAYQALKSKWSRIQPPVTMPYGMRQLHLRDPDNFHLCFEHPAA